MKPLLMNRNESLIFSELKKNHKPMTAYSLLDVMRAHGIRSPLQIYRALAKLQALGLVHKLERLNAFIACLHSFEGDKKRKKHGLSLFTICQNCSHVNEFCDEAIEAFLENKVKEAGFFATHTTIEIAGNCVVCRG